MFKKVFGPIVIVLVGLFPIILLLIGSPESHSFATKVSAYDSLARITSLAALSLLALNIVLSARLRIFDRLFLGLDRTYRFHRIIGGSVLILVLVHAMLITAKYSSISLLSGYEYLKPNLDYALMAGKVGLSLMLAGIFVSMYVTIKYKWFINIQRLLGAVIFIGGYHALFVTGTDLKTNNWLLGYFVIIGGLAAGLYIYRSLLHKPIRRQLMYAVESVEVKLGIAQIWLKPVGKALPFYAGQFGFFRFNSAAVDDESHPFTISSGSDDARLRLSIKALGDYSTSIQGVSAGDTVMVEGPYGNFSFTKVSSNKQAWIAGGVGITPFLSMAQSLPTGYDVTLLYCTRTLAEANIFLDELQQVSQRNPGFKVVTVSQDKGQRLSVDMLKKANLTDYLLCAPIGMMRDVESQLVAAGVPSGNIYYEEFELK